MYINRLYGGIFMNLTFFVSLLSDELKTKYYEEIIKNGEVNEELWREISGYLGERYKKIYSVEEHIIELLRSLEDVEKSRLMMSIQKNDIYLFNKTCTQLFSFEDIINVDKDRVKIVLSNFHIDMICKAMLATSPKVVNYLQSIFSEIDYSEARKKFGNIQINEILDAQDEIMEAINNKKILAI
jgi:flagellar motor switch protein FliG